ncbi:class I SAM-dependent methyltransferase [Spiroplasma endosymbiont of Aspidapion aeneum]|uniref:tRNA (adenine(22)-N(1))-methyltransferase n=1 Tax=Spiroplasma endosymbiont of Aspidapion aeneum TaxID=3066276 RepID=UPI00313DD2CF
MINLITNRIQAIASLIDTENIVCDIGTDHGYTAIYIAKDLKAQKIFASDINNKPLSIAKKNVKKYGVEHKVETILSDGLDFIINDKIKINVCIISGLGGNTILSILEKDCNLIDSYIICAHNNTQKIRTWTKNKKYFIQNEKVIEDNNIFYEVIKINKYAGVKIKSKYDILFGPLMRKNISKAFVSYWARIEERDRDIYQALVQSDKLKAKKYKIKLKMINKVIGKEIVKYV